MIKEIPEFRNKIEENIQKYYNNTLNDFVNRYGEAFTELHNELIINENLTKAFDLINYKIEEIWKYLLYLLEPFEDIPRLTYNELIEYFDNFYHSVKNNTMFFYQNSITYEFNEMIDNITNNITNHYVNIILSNNLLSNNLNLNTFDIFKSVYTKEKIKKMEKIAKSIIEKNNLGKFISLYNETINQFLNNLKINIENKKKEIEKMFSNKINELNSSFINIFQMTNQYQNDLDSLFNNLIFVVENISNYYIPYLKDDIKPNLKNITEKYENISDNSLDKVDTYIKNMKDYVP